MENVTLDVSLDAFGGLSVSKEVLGALGSGRVERNPYRRNKKPAPRVFVQMVFLVAKRERSNEHINYKSSINVTDVGLARRIVE